MKFYGPLKSHEHTIKTNPQSALIVDAILLGVVVVALILINVLVIVNYGFSVLLILSWLLLGSIAAWLISCIVKCVKT